MSHISNAADYREELAIVPVLAAHHAAQLNLCDQLEALADNLPDNITPQQCISVAWQLYPIVKGAHEFEEKSLFPMLTSVSKDDQKLTTSLERLQFEHWEDESFAIEIATVLRQLASNRDDVNIDKVSYMLRGFFEGLRRHIAFENEHILPLLQNFEPNIEMDE